MNASDAITGSSKIAIVEVVVVKRSEFLSSGPRPARFLLLLPAGRSRRRPLGARAPSTQWLLLTRVLYELTSQAYPLRIYYRNLGTGTGTGTPES